MSRPSPSPAFRPRSLPAPIPPAPSTADRPPVPSGRRPTTTPATEALWGLVRGIDEALAAGPPGDPVLFSVSGAGPVEPGLVEVGWHPIESDDPVDALLGFVAPAVWHAVGVVSAGRAHPLDAGGLPGNAPGPSRRASQEPEPARVVLAIARSGGSFSRVRVGARVFDTSEAVQGRVADALRRSFGLPTAPPPGTSAELWTTVWLDRIVEVAVAADPDSLRSWSEVAILHPAAGAASPATPPSGTAAPRPPDAPPSRLAAPPPPAAPPSRVATQPSPAAPPSPTAAPAPAAAPSRVATQPSPAAPPSPTAAPAPAAPTPPDVPAAPSDVPAVPSIGPEDSSAPSPDGASRLGRSRPPRAMPARAWDTRGREPDALAADALALADMWPWRRLRTEPHQLDVGPSPVASRIAAWMDDGMFARWLLGAFPPMPDLLATCDDLLPRPIVARLLATVSTTLDAMAPVP